ncbi:helix-turn-helix domain-containing protein [Streptomyces sp. NPDC058613]|uniref:helix-turn-helix domain-containing protein n=1 Tax=unclassified Streptomyces TaxID=2593676 RepID=UPI00364FD792
MAGHQFRAGSRPPVAVNGNPTVTRPQLGPELRRLRWPATDSTQVAARLLVSQSKISNLKNGHRAIKPRDVRDLCALYQVTDPHVDCRSSSSGHAEVGQRGRPARSSASWPDIATVS